MREQGRHHALLTFYHEIIALRKGSPALRNRRKEYLTVVFFPEEQTLMLHRWQPQEEAVLIFASRARESVCLSPSLPPGRWHKLLDAEERRFGGAAHATLASILDSSTSCRLELPPFAFAIYRAEGYGKGGERGEI